MNYEIQALSADFIYLKFTVGLVCLASTISNSIPHGQSKIN